MFAFSTDVTKHVLVAPMDIDEALSLEEMVVRNTFKARLLI